MKGDDVRVIEQFKKEIWADYLKFKETNVEKAEEEELTVEDIFVGYLPPIY